jgi:Flp pilus assembly protein TadG
MSYACNKPRRWQLGHAGVTTLEFALVAVLFLLVLIGCMDLGRYYLIQHSLRTVAAEAARMTLAYDNNSTATQPTTASFAAIAPFIDTSNLNVTVQQPNFSGVTIIMVTATYPFVAWSPLWSASLDGTISESTELQD